MNIIDLIDHNSSKGELVFIFKQVFILFEIIIGICAKISLNSSAEAAWGSGPVIST